MSRIIGWLYAPDGRFGGILLPGAMRCWRRVSKREWTS